MAQARAAPRWEVQAESSSFFKGEEKNEKEE